MTKWEGLLGLCARAGRLQSGGEACLKLIRSGEARLVVVDEGASENTRKMLSDACAYRGVPMRALPAGALAHAIGRPGRMGAAVTDGGFAKGLLEQLDTITLD